MGLGKLPLQTHTQSIHVLILGLCVWLGKGSQHGQTNNKIHRMVFWNGCCMEIIIIILLEISLVTSLAVF